MTSTPERVKLFEITNSNGSATIYTDGTADGFGEAYIVANYYPALLAIELAKVREECQCGRV